MTMIREPIAWAFSKITHKKNRRVESTVARAASKRRHASIECAKINFARFALEHLGSPLGPECDAPAQAALARRRLDASIVGLVEDLDASLCLWEYQFGHHRANATDYARRCDCRGAARRAAAAASAAAAPAGGNHRGSETRGQVRGTRPSLRAVLRIEAALRPHARLYDYAAGLFGGAPTWSPRDGRAAPMHDDAPLVFRCQAIMLNRLDHRLGLGAGRARVQRVTHWKRVPVSCRTGRLAALVESLPEGRSWGSPDGEDHGASENLFQMACRVGEFTRRHAIPSPHIGGV